ncbi:MAG: dienelactone hydrolase family protein [Chloroflexi bacterium]|nr:dienelactone hydrolase family protein [Chloroflexota bacterium]
MQGAARRGLAGEIGLYGPPIADGLRGPEPASRVANSTCPTLGLFGGADPLFPAETIAEWDPVLEAGGVSREIVA